MSLTRLANDPDRVLRIICDNCSRAYITHPSASASRDQLQGYATDHGWDCGAFADECPPCRRNRGAAQ